MAEYPLLKDFINEQLLEQVADRVVAVHPAFDRDGFVKAVMAELASLELKARTLLIAEKLHDFLPSHFPDALRILLAILDDERGFEPIENAGLRLMAIPAFVERYGLPYPEVSLAALPIITRVSSCEFAIRPFVLKYPTDSMARLQEWAKDSDEHLRRLASEGSRPRLPWGARLPNLIADPSPSLALLERLKDDPSLYVRRSVANHLNDIGKDHPELLLARMEKWKPGAGKERLWLINHALRSLVKRGDRRALAILGYGEAQVEISGLKLAPAVLRFGDELGFSFEMRNRAEEAQNLMVDFVMHFRKANGKTAPKVFKLKKMRLDAGASTCVSKRFAIRPISTRRYYPGRQRLEIQINGRVLGGADFELVME